MTEPTGIPVRSAGIRATIMVAVSAVVIAVLLVSCEERVKPTVASVSGGEDLPTQESWSATITFTDSGRVTAVLHAGHIAMFAEKKITVLDSNIVVDFYDSDQHHSSVLTARRGIVNDVTHDFEAHDHVVVLSDSGTTLKTEELHWLNRIQQVRTEAFVEITSPTEQIQGHGLESDQSLKHYTIFRVTGQAKTDE